MSSQFSRNNVVVVCETRHAWDFDQICASMEVDATFNIGGTYHCRKVFHGLCRIPEAPLPRIWGTALINLASVEIEQLANVDHSQGPRSCKLETD